MSHVSGELHLVSTRTDATALQLTAVDTDRTAQLYIQMTVDWIQPNGTLRSNAQSDANTNLTTVARNRITGHGESEAREKGSVWSTKNDRRSVILYVRFGEVTCTCFKNP